MTTNKRSIAVAMRLGMARDGVLREAFLDAGGSERMPPSAKLGTYDRVVTSQPEPPILGFKDALAFEKWLERNFEDQNGLWLKLAKVGKGVPSITYPEAVEVALCFGWIDGLKRGLDETHWLQRFTPRRARSMWSQINRDKAEELVASGRMRPSGLAEIERAKADGRWDLAYAGQASASVPPEVAADPEALAALEKLDKVNRYAYVHRIHNAKRPDTKAKLIQKLREGHRFHQ